MVALIVQPRIRLRLVHPVDRRIIEQLAIAQRQVDVEPVVRAPRLQQRDVMLAALAQPVGQHTPRRASADDDVVGFQVRLSPGVGVCSAGVQQGMGRKRRGRSVLGGSVTIYD